MPHIYNNVAYTITKKNWDKKCVYGTRLAKNPIMFCMWIKYNRIFQLGQLFFGIGPILIKYLIQLIS